LVLKNKSKKNAYKKRATTFRQRLAPTQTINQKQFVQKFIYFLKLIFIRLSFGIEFY